MKAVEYVGLKLEKDFLSDIETVMKKHRYMTKTEFIREAIRDKIKQLEKEESLKAIERVFGKSKHKTSDDDLHKAREKLAKGYEKKFNVR